MSLSVPDLGEIRAAAKRIEAHAHRTPVLTCGSLDAMAGARLFFKCECFQRAGAFKFRGASNAVLSLPEEQARRGVVTHSSGNHAAALALAAQLRGIPAHIVMPRDAPRIKQQAVAAYGGRITLCEPTLAGRHSGAAGIQAETGAVLVHPYDDPAVVAGQGTVALEFLEQAPGLDAMIAPVSGGGLLGGLCLATAALSPGTELYGAEPLQADDACRSLREGRLVPGGAADTIADGLRAALSERTFAVLRRHVREILTVTETQIVAAMRLVWERMKLVIEPSAAVPVAAVLAERERFQGRRVGVVLSGGNVDLEHLPWQA